MRAQLSMSVSASRAIRSWRRSSSGKVDNSARYISSMRPTVVSRRARYALLELAGRVLVGELKQHPPQGNAALAGMGAGVDLRP